GRPVRSSPSTWRSRSSSSPRTSRPPPRATAWAPCCARASGSHRQFCRSTCAAPCPSTSSSRPGTAARPSTSDSGPGSTSPWGCSRSTSRVTWTSRWAAAVTPRTPSRSGTCGCAAGSTSTSRTVGEAESPLALVLSGGGARGAYEVGVLRYVLGKLTPRLGENARPRIFSGTSVGAINACGLAAHHDVSDFAVRQLAERWRHLGLEQIFRLGWGDLTGLARWLLGSGRANGPNSLLDAAPLAELVRSVIP